MMSQPLLVLVGPTAVGKTALSLPLAQMLRAEILNVDSRQMYRYMDIGTAKPTALQRAFVPHHLLDLLSPDQPNNAVHFLAAAHRAIEEIQQRGRRVLVVAGSGLYLQALLYGLMPAPPAQADLRAALHTYADHYGTPALHQRLQALDPRAAQQYHPHDRVRIIRALEITYVTGEAFSTHCQRHQRQTPIYPYIGVALQRERLDLYRRIEARTEAMFEDGWLAEVDALVARGYGAECPAMNSLGYRELLAYRAGQASWESTVAAIKQATRRFAKRQLTWFRKMPHVHWYSLTDSEDQALVESLYHQLESAAQQRALQPCISTSQQRASSSVRRTAGVEIREPLESC